MKCVNLFGKKGNNLQIMTTMVYGFKIIRCLASWQKTNKGTIHKVRMQFFAHFSNFQHFETPSKRYVSIFEFFRQTRVQRPIVALCKDLKLFSNIILKHKTVWI